MGCRRVNVDIYGNILGLRMCSMIGLLPSSLSGFTYFSEIFCIKLVVLRLLLSEFACIRSLVSTSIKFEVICLSAVT